MSKDTQTFQFNQSERMNVIKTPEEKLEEIWVYTEKMLLKQLKMMKRGYVGDFEVIIRRKD